jgi:hypothetical protein
MTRVLHGWQVVHRCGERVLVVFDGDDAFGKRKRLA